MTSKVLIIIPAYNEEKNISFVVENIKQYRNRFDYVVVNDGSTDKTYEICCKQRYNVVNLPVNLGLSGAFQAGMKYAEALHYDYAIQIDGDGQHNVNYILPLLDYALFNNCDITIGSRYINARKPWNMRMIGSRIISCLILLTTKHRIADPTSGMRLYNKRAIHALSREMNFGPEPDTLSYMMNNGYTVGEVQVHMNDRHMGDSYLKGMESVRYMVKMCCSIIIMKLF